MGPYASVPLKLHGHAPTYPWSSANSKYCSSVVGGGEIRGFWAAAVPAENMSWGKIRNLYR